jgi:hypothetical protein
VPKTHLEIISDKGGPSKMAAALNVKPARTRMWKLRKRIPRSVWPELIEAYPDLNTDVLKAGEAA